MDILVSRTYRQILRDIVNKIERWWFECGKFDTKQKAFADEYIKMVVMLLKPPLKQVIANDQQE